MPRPRNGRPPHRFKKGEPRPPGAGRKKGTPNKFTTIKQAILQAVEELGGHEWVKRVGRRHPGTLLNVAGRLLPHEVSISGPQGEPPSLTVNVIHSKKK